MRLTAELINQGFLLQDVIIDAFNDMMKETCFQKLFI
jgi:hypothetical protein